MAHENKISLLKYVTAAVHEFVLKNIILNIGTSGQPDLIVFLFSARTRASDIGVICSDISVQIVPDN